MKDLQLFTIILLTISIIGNSYQQSKNNSKEKEFREICVRKAYSSGLCAGVDIMTKIELREIKTKEESSKAIDQSLKNYMVQFNDDVNGLESCVVGHWIHHTYQQ